MQEEEKKRTDKDNEFLQQLD